VNPLRGAIRQALSDDVTAVNGGAIPNDHQAAGYLSHRIFAGSAPGLLRGSRGSRICHSSSLKSAIYAGRWAGMGVSLSDCRVDHAAK
jgi:hypothetical protein